MTHVAKYVLQNILGCVSFSLCVILLNEHIDKYRIDAMIITLFLGLVRVSRCYRCPWNNHGGQIDFLSGYCIVVFHSSFLFTPFGRRFSLRSGGFSRPRRPSPVSVFPSGLFTQSSSFLVVLRSIAAPAVPLASLLHSRCSSPCSGRSLLIPRRG